MTTTLTATYTVTGGAVLVLDMGDGHTQHCGIPAGLALGDLRYRNPLAFVAISEFQQTGAETGTVTVSAA